MSRRTAPIVALLLAACALTAPTPKSTPAPRETRFYTADNPTELSQIVNGSAAQGCRMLQVVPWKEAFIAVMECPPGSHAAPACGSGGRCPIEQ
ncbi:MAG TPA: hypothetical protein VG755_02450 [Nannocystaceae bacterium]|nr:hypothetical protein [Nannocystaceae bacterium]